MVTLPYVSLEDSPAEGFCYLFALTAIGPLPCHYHGCRHRRAFPLPWPAAQEGDRSSVLPHSVPPVRWARGADCCAGHRGGPGGSGDAGIVGEGRVSWCGDVRTHHWRKYTLHRRTLSFPPLIPVTYPLQCMPGHT